jgi:hypothetical protein
MIRDKIINSYQYFMLSVLFMLLSCEENDPLPVSAERTFKMGFTTWSYTYLNKEKRLELIFKYPAEYKSSLRYSNTDF